MKITTLKDIEEFRERLGLLHKGVLLEEDIDEVNTDCDLNGRKRKDAEVLCTIAANSSGKALDIGTSHGRSAYKLATNLKPGSKVFTVNLLPEQYMDSSGNLITHLLAKEEIGSYYRQQGIKCIEQIYADTSTWNMPAELSDLSMAFVDGAHDAAIVYSDSKKAYERLMPGGFLLWHDFNPELCQKYSWINDVMCGAEAFLRELKMDLEVFHLQHSWVGVIQKPLVKDYQLSSKLTSMREEQSDPMKSLRYMLAYPAYSAARIEEEEQWCKRMRALGYEVEAFGIPCPEGWLAFGKLHLAWNDKSPYLMLAYAELKAKMEDRHVLIAGGGSMLHPDFLNQLSAYKVMLCADDPESSDVLSRPVAHAFDYCFPFNIDCIEMYKSWGCKNVEWLFHTNQAHLLGISLVENSIRNQKRDIDIIMLCERIYGASDRAQRIELLVNTFPQAFVRGRGWPGGYVDSPNECYLRSKIGWNLHNSTGPVNTRTFSIPYLGIMQICDNKNNLGKIYELDKEVVGFDTLAECIDKTRYYLAHEDERMEIALRGWRRASTDYTEEKQWQKLIQTIAPTCLKRFGVDGTEIMNTEYSTALELASLGEIAKAIDLLNSISPAFHDYAYVQNDVGALQYQLGNFSEALAHLRVAEGLKKDDILVLRNLIEVTAALNLKEETQHLLSKLMTIEPNNKDAQDRFRDFSISPVDTPKWE